jgi:hypothetical protein
VWNGIAPSTRKTYTSAVSLFHSFACRYQLPSLPVQLKSLLAWIANLSPTVTQGTIRGYIKGLRHYHVEHRLDCSVFDEQLVELTIRGGRRIYGDKPARERLPLTSDILLPIVRLLATDPSLDTTNLKTALCVGFAAFLRSGEFTWNRWDPSLSPQLHLSRKHVTFVGDSVSLFLPTSKTDQFRKGVTIHLASADSPLCPVAALHHLLERYPAPPTAPLFLRSAGLPFNRAYLVDRIKTLLIRIGVNPAKYSGHSLRKGATVSAIAVGLSKDEVKLLGRWKSNAVDIYINEVDKLSHAKRMLALNFKIFQPINTEVIPGIVTDIALDTDFAEL